MSVKYIDVARPRRSVKRPVGKKIRDIIPRTKYAEILHQRLLGLKGGKRIPVKDLSDKKPKKLELTGYMVDPVYRRTRQNISPTSAQKVPIKVYRYSELSSLAVNSANLNTSLRQRLIDYVVEVWSWLKSAPSRAISSIKGTSDGVIAATSARLGTLRLQRASVNYDVNDGTHKSSIQRFLSYMETIVPVAAVLIFTWGVFQLGEPSSGNNGAVLGGHTENHIAQPAETDQGGNDESENDDAAKSTEATKQKPAVYTQATNQEDSFMPTPLRQQQAASSQQPAAIGGSDEEEQQPALPAKPESKPSQPHQPSSQEPAESPQNNGGNLIQAVLDPVSNLLDQTTNTVESLLPL